jgi:spore coat protein A
MNVSRRDVLRLAGLAGLAPFTSGCLNRRPEEKLLQSQIPLPRAFEVPLPIPRVIQPGGDGVYQLNAETATASIIPGMNTEIFGYNGTFPGPVFEARSGQKTVVRLRNDLAVPVVNHLHGGRTPPDSDGYPTDYVMPGATREYTYPNQQRAATLWYHDHRMDFTGPQVYRGLAGMYIIRDDEELKLPLPRGEKEIPLVICDRSFDFSGGFLYPSLDRSLKGEMGVQPEYMGGVLGDVILVNGAPWPRLDVANTRYRFRILNGSNARRYELALDPPSSHAAFLQIGSDGGFLPAPIRQRTLRMAPAERFDVIVDFAGYKPGSTVTLVNRAAEGPQSQVMQFRVTRNERDDSSVPAFLSAVPEPDRSSATVNRVFKFSYKRGMKSWTINGKDFDVNRIDASPKLNSTEIWQLESDFSHPLHLHLVHFRVLSHSGRPGPWDSGWKDTIDLVAGQTANILVNFKGYEGRYVFHCHNLEHEDMSMMGNFQVVRG